MAFKNILVAVHPLENESTALQRAALLARQCGATLNLQMVLWKPHLSLQLFHRAEELEHRQEEILQSATDRLDRLSQDLKGVTVGRREVHWGHPFHEVLLRSVEQHRPDLVVVATTRDEHPSTSEWQFIRDCKVPLLLCHHRDWGQPPRILACVDPGHAHDKSDEVDRAVIEAAEKLQDSLGEDYQLMHAAGMTPNLSGDQPYTYQFREHQDSSNESAIRALLPERSADKPISFSHSSPAEAILAFVEVRKFDICVLGLINRGRLREMLIGSTPRQVIPRMNCDLLLMPHPAAGWASNGDG